MKFCLIALSALGLFGIISCEGLKDYTIVENTFRDVDECNRFVEALTKEIREDEGGDLDPYDLKEKLFVLKLPFLPRLEAKLHNSWVSGLSTLKPASDCDIHITNTEHTVKVALKLDPLMLKSTGYVKLLKEHELSFFGKVQRTDINLDMSVDKDTNKPYLTDLNVRRMEGVEVNTNAPKILDKVIGFVIDAVKPFWKKGISEAVEEKIRLKIDDLLTNL